MQCNIAELLKKEENPAICNNMRDLRDIIPSETSQMRKDKYCVISQVESKITKLTESENTTGTRGRGFGEMVVKGSKGRKFQLFEMNKS
jgi:hypothetical protein